MRTIDEYHTQNDEYFHPLWLGIIILFSVISIIGFILLCKNEIWYTVTYFIQSNML